MIRLFGIQLSFQKWLLVMALFTGVLYLNTLKNGYNLDDELVTQQHLKTSKGISALSEIWTTPYFEDGAGNRFGYRPTTLSSFAIEHTLFGESASTSHLINLFIYIFLVCSVAFLFKILLPEQAELAVFGAFIFAVLPIHVEAVASIKNRDELLALLFALVSAFYFYKWEQKNKWYYVFLMVCGAVLSVTSKKSAVPIILIFPVLLYLLYPKNWNWKIALLHFLWASPTLYFALDFNLKLALGASLILSGLLFSFFTFKDWMLRLKRFLPYIYALVLIGTLGLVFFFGTNYQDKIPIPKPILTNQTVGAGMKEGRDLTYVENPLVSHYDWEHRFALGAITTINYIQLIVIPVELSAYYGFGEVKPYTFFCLPFLLSLALLMSIVIYLLWTFTKTKILRIGAFWFFGFIVLFSNIPVLVAGGIAERLALSASIGLSLIIAYLLLKCRIYFKFLPFLILGIYTLTSFKRNQYWESDYKLMIHDIKNHPNCAQLANLAGIACMKRIQDNTLYLSESEQQELMNEAARYFKKSISIYPYSFNTQYDLGRVLMDLGKYREAHIQFTKALLYNPKNELGLEEQLRAAYLSKDYQKVTQYLALQHLSFDRELVLEIAAHTALLTNQFEKSQYYVNLGLMKFPKNQNFIMIQNELAKK